MPYITDHKQKFADLKHHMDNQDQLRKMANGGNSILFSYPPDEENLYINKAKNSYFEEVTFIDISQLLVRFIDADGWDSIRDYYNEYKNTPHKVFHSDDSSEDLFDLIIQDIVSSSQNSRIPFLIRTGCLFGTGIDNLQIMENKAVIRLPHPLIIFYPSRIEEDNILFLNFRPASKYRCVLVM